MGERFDIDTRTMRAYDTPADQTLLLLHKNNDGGVSANDTMLEAEAAERCRQLLGGLMWMSSTCRLDAAQAVYRIPQLMTSRT